MQQQYTQAVIELIQSGSPVTDVCAGLQKVLSAKGHQKLYAPILRALKNYFAVSSDSQTPVVFTAGDSLSATEKKRIEEVLESLQAPQAYLHKVDQTIIGGQVVSYNHTRVDQSYKTALTALYRSITK